MSTETPPTDHKTRMARASMALDGLSVDDAFGANIFPPGQPAILHHPHPLPPPPWRYTDDTEMALGIVEVLERHGHIDQDELVHVFERRYWANPNRGYGPNIHAMFRAIRRCVPWRTAATAPVPGQEAPGVWARLGRWLGRAAAPGRSQGSLGNGGAMRVTPVGAYFAEDILAVIAQADASAAVTHAHTDGRAGAIAVAVAAAWAWRCHAKHERHTPAALLDFVLDQTPAGPTRAGIGHARGLMGATPMEAAGLLGNGCPITSARTVPFTLWCAARHQGDFAGALWETASVGGDVDTNCAIVGGIVALAGGPESIPPDWLKSRETLCR